MGANRLPKLLNLPWTRLSALLASPDQAHANVRSAHRADACHGVVIALQARAQQTDSARDAPAEPAKADDPVVLGDHHGRDGGDGGDGGGRGDRGDRGESVDGSGRNETHRFLQAPQTHMQVAV